MEGWFAFGLRAGLGGGVKRHKTKRKPFVPDASKLAWLCRRCGTQYPLPRTKSFCCCGMFCSLVIAGTIECIEGQWLGEEPQRSLFQ